MDNIALSGSIIDYPHPPGSLRSAGAIHDDGPPGLREALPRFLSMEAVSPIAAFLWSGGVMTRPALRGMGQ